MTRWQSLRFAAFLLAATLVTPAQMVAGIENAQAPANTQARADTANASPEQIAAAAAERATFGLPADVGTVSALLGSSRDVGTPRWGIAMTAEEEASIDLPGRMAFADALSEQVLPYVQSLPTFGGVYIDQLANGGLVILLTQRDPVAEEEIAIRMPNPNRGLRIEQVAYTEAQLMDAVERARDVWGRILPSTQLLSVGIDTMRNRLLFVVVRRDLAEAEARSNLVEAELAVPIGLEAGEQDQDVDCTSRNHCHDPYKTGINIYKGVVDSVPECTMGFHIRIGTDEQFVTAGHCGYTGSDEWFEPVLGRIGIELATLYAQNGQDIMRLSMFDAQASDDIYNTGIPNSSSDITGSRAPILNEAACASLGTTNAIDCGTISSTWLSWVSNTAGFTVWGGDTSGISITNGDSGSPLYHLVSGTAVALGVIDTAGGLFARLDTSLDDWAASVVN